MGRHLDAVALTVGEEFFDPPGQVTEALDPQFPTHEAAPVGTQALRFAADAIDQR
ncbi:hypothetical protein D9M68_806160 [compost metagenome]